MLDLVAGARFELTTFGLWAQRATRLLHPASILNSKLMFLVASDGTEVIDFLYFVKKSLVATFCQTKAEPSVSRPQNKKAARNIEKGVRAALFVAV